MKNCTVVANKKGSILSMPRVCFSSQWVREHLGSSNLKSDTDFLVLMWGLVNANKKFC